MKKSRGPRKRRYAGDAMEEMSPTAWMRAFTKELLEEIQAAKVLPYDILRTVVNYAFKNPTIHLRVQKDLDKWPFKSSSPYYRRPFEDINLKLSNTLLEFMAAYQRIRPATPYPADPTQLLTKLFLTFDEELETLDLELTLPNLHLQIGEALHLIGVTWKQLQERLCVVQLKLKFIHVYAIE